MAIDIKINKKYVPDSNIVSTNSFINSPLSSSAVGGGGGGSQDLQSVTNLNNWTDQGIRFNLSGLTTGGTLVYRNASNELVIKSDLRIEGNVLAESDVLAYQSGASNNSIFDQLENYIDDNTIKWDNSNNYIYVNPSFTGGSGGGNNNCVTSLSLNSGTGVLSLNQQTGGTKTVDLSPITASTFSGDYNDLSNKPNLLNLPSNFDWTSDAEPGASDRHIRLVACEDDDEARLSLSTCQSSGSNPGRHDALTLFRDSNSTTTNIGINNTSPANRLDVCTDNNFSAGISLNGNPALTACNGGAWLRLNNSCCYSNGTYTPGKLRADCGAEFRGDGENLILRQKSSSQPNYIRGKDENGNNNWYVGNGSGSCTDLNLMNYCNSRTNIGTNNTQFMCFESSGVHEFRRGLNMCAIGNDDPYILMYDDSATVQTIIRSYESSGIQARFLAGGIEACGHICSSCDVVAFSSISDCRMKKDINTLSQDCSMNVISNLKPVEFKYKEKDNKCHIGFIAQEVQKLDNRLVGGTENEKYYLYYDKFNVHLTNSVQSLIQKNMDLENKNKQLENRLEKMESKLNNLIEKLDK